MYPYYVVITTVSRVVFEHVRTMRRQDLSQPKIYFRRYDVRPSRFEHAVRIVTRRVSSSLGLWHFRAAVFLGETKHQ